ncbi:hypothetical protein BX600DRAFT_440348 [Xylariales sp. PMI_506]|nr:hypothetical protein BX600DRAFT_440348 [Xylariales sp. PMI_506]
MTSHLTPSGRHGRGYQAINEDTDPIPSGRASPLLEPSAEEKIYLTTQDFADTQIETSTEHDDLKPLWLSPPSTRLVKHPWRHIIPALVSSVVICLLIAGLLKWFQGVDMGEKNQMIFSTILAVLAILLASNLKSAGSDALDVIRWRFFATGKAQATGVLVASSISGRGYKNVIRTAWENRSRKPVGSLMMLIGLLVITVAVLSVCLVGFTYEFVKGSSNLAYKADMTSISYGSHNTEASSSTSMDVEYFSSHLYGDMSYALIDGMPNSAMWAGGAALAYNSDSTSGEQGWTYTFRDSNADGTAWMASGRSIQVKAKCLYYAIVEGQQGDSDSITYLNGTSRTVLYNIQKAAPGATVWANARSDVSPWSYCGTRCARVFAFQYLRADQASTDYGSLFDCDITVSGVAGGQSEDDISDDVAATFAGSIGWRGFISGTDKWQYSRYSRDLVWGEDMGTNATSAAYKAGKFAAGSVAMADVLNPRQDSSNQAATGASSSGIILAVYWLRVFGFLLTHER